MTIEGADPEIVVVKAEEVQPTYQSTTTTATATAQYCHPKKNELALIFYAVEMMFDQAFVLDQVELTLQ